MAALLADLLGRLGYTAERREETLLCGGVTLSPQFISVDPIHPKGARTGSVIAYSHPRFGTLSPFEYQYASGEDITAAFTHGFESWADLDWRTILDALGTEPVHSQLMLKTFPGIAPDSGALHRRIVLGPISHAVTESVSHAGPDHDFCPCCLITQSFDAFSSLFETDAFYGIRLFAAREADGTVQADCRINGEDFDVGRNALRQYALTWPSRGFEYRKQYVIMQSMPEAHQST